MVSRILKTIFTRTLSISFLLVLLVIIASVASIKGINPVVNQSPVIDGVISLNEYSSSISFAGGNYQLFWEVIEPTNISIGIWAQTTGWVAVGFDPSYMMLDADMIYAWVEPTGTVVIKDAYSLSVIGIDHPEDITQGGTFDILEYNGSENATSTTIEFSRLLITDDQDYDNDIPSEGSLKIIWAYGTSDSFNQFPSAKGSSTMTISPTQLTTSTDTSSPVTTTTITTIRSALGFQSLILILGLVGIIVVYPRKR